MHRLLLVLAVTLAVACPAHAAPKPIAYAGFSEHLALAGDHVLFALDGGISSAPISGGAVEVALPASKGHEVMGLAASATRSAALVISGRTEPRAQVFAGPPFAPLTPPALSGGADPYPLGVDVDGDHVATTEFSVSGGTTITVRDPQPHTYALEAGNQPSPLALAGDLVAYPINVPDRDPRFPNRRLQIRDWRTGEVRSFADLPDAIAWVDLRPDGRALAVTAHDGLYDIPAGGTPRLVAFNVEVARFAGERIVFVGGTGLRVLDPGGRIRRFGVPTRRLTGFATDDTRVLFDAAGCLLVADVTDAPAASVGAGPCPRSELAVRGPGSTRGRTLSVPLQCVVAAATCEADIRLKLGKHDVSGWQHFRVPVKHTRHVAIELTAALGHEGEVSLDSELRFGRLVVPFDSFLVQGR